MPLGGVRWSLAVVVPVLIRWSRWWGEQCVTAPGPVVGHQGRRSARRNLQARAHSHAIASGTPEKVGYPATAGRLEDWETSGVPSDLTSSLTTASRPTWQRRSPPGSAASTVVSRPPSRGKGAETSILTAAPHALFFSWPLSPGPRLGPASSQTVPRHRCPSWELSGVPPTRVYMSHGRVDDQVSAKWGESTAEGLRKTAGLEGLSFREHEGVMHELEANQARERDFFAEGS